MAITALDVKTSKFLSTAQIITSVSTAVKELVENSLDAGANNIEIKLEDNGASLLEVSDNGKGIAKVDTSFMALQSYTSKIKDFADLDTLESYGFRGEALASLCRVADVTIITKTYDDDIARLYIMNSNGNIENSELSHRSIGTTVQARSIFKDLPVRRQIMNGTKRSNQDLKLLETTLRSFAICHPRVRINYRVNGSNVLTKPSTETTRESLLCLFGKKCIAQCDFMEKKTEEVDLHLMIPTRDAKEMLDVCQVGQHVFVNKRPVLYKEIEKLINQRLVEHFGDKIPARKKPGFLAILDVPPADIDVNLEPNKTTVLLTKLAKIIETLDKLLVTYYGIVEKTQDTSFDKSIINNDTTSEYHDCTSTEIKTTNDVVAPPSSKKRKLNDKNEDESARDGSAAKIAAMGIGSEKTPKHCRTAKNLFEMLANQEKHCSNTETENNMETMSQLPVVDLGEDFSSEEILKLLNRDTGDGEAISENSIKNESRSSMLVSEVPLHRDSVKSERTLQNTVKDDSKLSTVIPEMANELTEKAWSKGHVPINLHGVTDVRIYNNAIACATGEIEEHESETKIMGCKGFRMFSKEIRPEIIRDNPGINFVEVAKLLTTRWKALSPEERGYYRDVAAADAAQQVNDTSTCSNKSTKHKVSTEHAESNRKRFLNMLENMKNPKTSTKKKENLKMRTVVPWSVNLENVTNSFEMRRQSNVVMSSKNIVLGSLNDNIWLARTGYQIWALSIAHLFEGMNLEKSDETEKTWEKVESLVANWVQNKENLSRLHPVFELA